MIGRNIPLYGIDVEAYKQIEENAQSIFEQFLTGDYRNVSLFILGLWPHMIASVFMMAYTAVSSMDQSQKASPNKMKRLTLVFTVIIGAVSAIQKVNSFVYINDGRNIYELKCLAFLELMAGMLIVTNLCQKNTKYGIGGRSSIVLINVMSGFVNMISSKKIENYVMAAVIGFLLIAVMIILESTEKRIPVQRVSIRNVHAEKSYVAYKLNPAGVMPIMFASSFMMIPQMIIDTLIKYYPNDVNIIWVSENMNLNKPFGICIYLGIIFLLTIGFSLITLAPWKTADDMMKAGDSLVDIYAGKKTRRYLIATLVKFSVFSALILCICVGVPLFLQVIGKINSSIAMLPFSVMMITGLWINLYREYEVYGRLDKYRSFL